MNNFSTCTVAIRSHIFMQFIAIKVRLRISTVQVAIFCFAGIHLFYDWVLPLINTESLSICFCFRSMVGWTYRSIVIFTLAWPRISLKDFTSNPSSIHLVANVWRSAWKLASAIPQASTIALKRFSIVRGST